MAAAYESKVIATYIGNLMKNASRRSPKAMRLLEWLGDLGFQISCQFECREEGEKEIRRRTDRRGACLRGRDTICRLSPQIIEPVICESWLLSASGSSTMTWDLDAVIAPFRSALTEALRQPNETGALSAIGVAAFPESATADCVARSRVAYQPSSSVFRPGQLAFLCSRDSAFNPHFPDEPLNLAAPIPFEL